MSFFERQQSWIVPKVLGNGVIKWLGCFYSNCAGGRSAGNWKNGRSSLLVSLCTRCESEKATKKKPVYLSCRCSNKVSKRRQKSRWRAVWAIMMPNMIVSSGTSEKREVSSKLLRSSADTLVGFVWLVCGVQTVKRSLKSRTFAFWALDQRVQRR